MTKQRKTFIVILFCVAYLLQPFAALASNIDRTFHEEIIGVTIEYGYGTPTENVLVFQLDNDIQGYNHEFSDGTTYYGTDVEDKSSSSIAVILSTPAEPSLFESSYEYYLPTNHFKSIPQILETRPPITI